MSILPIGSGIPSKRRMKKQSKAQRSLLNGRAPGEAAEGVSVLAEGTLQRDSQNQVAYRGTDQSGVGSAVTATVVSTESVAPNNELQPYPNDIFPLSSQSEVLEKPDDGGSAFMELGGDCFAQGRPKHTMQSQIAGEQVYNLHQDGELQTLQPGGKPMDAIGEIDFDTNIRGDLPYSNMNFGRFSIPSNSDQSFVFNPQIEIPSEWPPRSLSSRSTSSIATTLSHTDSPQMQQTGFSICPGQGVISNWNDNNDNKTDILFDPFTYDQSQDQVLPDQKNEVKPERRRYSWSAEEAPRLLQTAPPKKGCRKRSSSKANESIMSESSGHSGRKKVLGCPFYKHNPQRHNNCNKYRLHRIKDVKQHIYRHHCKPEIYCPCCFQNFGSSGERDSHIRGNGCVLKEVPDFDGTISENQRKRLKRNGSRGASIEEQWTDLWSVIFPDTKPPRSPYIEGDQAELISYLRNYWDNNAGEIIERSLREQETEFQTLATIKRIVDIILDNLETKPADWDLSTNRESSGMSGQPPASENLSPAMFPFWQIFEVDQQSEIDIVSQTTSSSLTAANSPHEFQL
ncbi:hypothetical protein GGR51DRAFT_524377 [Nemania sp. FL0031]|nr:hypothetical protein GGR51DRAFT_524377 [Nemania sp. FL0031]